MNLDSQRMQLDAQRIQLKNQEETMRIQREEMQRACELQTKQTFLEAHKVDMQNSMMNNAMDYGFDITKFANPQQNTMMQQPAFGQMSGFGQMSSFGAAAQMPAMKTMVPQVQYNVYVNEQQTAGPFDWNQLQSLVQSGQVTKNTYVYTQGMANWELAGNVQELAPLFANTLPGMPTMM